MNPRYAAMFAALLGLLAAGPARAQEEPVPIPANIQSAVDRGLEWLAREQQRNGSWQGPDASSSVSAACTGLAVMAFMARGHVPGEGPYGETINRAIDYILSVQRADGVLAAGGQSQVMYDHGICTVALCEAYGMLDDQRQAAAHSAISRAVRLILNAQRVNKDFEQQGGWRYTPTAGDSDTSVTGWQLMALRGAASIGASLPPEAINAGIAYIKRRAVFGGGFAYMGISGVNVALTGTGVLALSLMGKRDEPEARAGGDYMLRNDLSTSNHYFYAVYYCSQAAWQLRGNYWQVINRDITSSLIAKQKADGSWGTASPGDSIGGNNYCTSMAVLALSVPYRYLPIYQR